MPEPVIWGVNAALLVAVVLLGVPCLVLFIECIAALGAGRRGKPGATTVPPSLAVLVPAHNEAYGIRATLEPLLQQLRPSDRLVVIADNCSDETASVARDTGATVIERTDLTRRGKGYALDFGLQYLADQPPDIVILMDADCIAEPGSIAQIANLAYQRRRPVQATYLLEQPAQSNPKQAVSTLAFTVKNLVRPSGLNQLGLPCLLTGTGMAFPWDAFNSVSLASGNIVEDMNLGLDLAIAGFPPLFCATANVTGVLPQQEKAATTQRTRWEHGHLQTLLTQVPRLLQAALQQGRGDLLAIALDLLVPPLSLLVMLWLVGIGMAALAAGLGLSALPMGLLVGQGVLLVMAILSAWLKYCRATLPLKTLVAIPLYILWKIPLYFAFLAKPETAWVRTERDLPPAK